MPHSHYIQFAHISRMKFWSYVDIRGKIEKSWGLYLKIFTDVSRMNHIKNPEETLKLTNEIRKMNE